jgi:WD40 repeat protein
MTQPYIYDLFISYTEADRAWVEGFLLDALEQAGIKYYSEDALALGVPRLPEFERAIKQSQRTLLVLSPAYMTDNFSQFADLLAQTYGLETGEWPVIPLILNPVSLPSRLSMLTALDATNAEKSKSAIERLCAELHRPVPGPATKPPCPYPGMVPFTEHDADQFFGRDREVAELRRRLRHQNYMFVIGSSGSGKSSLVFAGLVAELNLHQLGVWVVRTMRPGAMPLVALAQALGQILPRSRQLAARARIAALAQMLGQAPQPSKVYDAVIATVLAQTPPARHLLLVIDQLEELFTQSSKSDQVAFIAAIKSLRQMPSCVLVLTMRADFYEDLMTSDLWPVEPSERMEIAPLRDAALRAAITRPAERLNVYLEAGLLERLLADAADEPGILPLIQETMVLLWEMMERRLLPLSAYEQLGSGGRSGLAVAIATKADATLAALSSAQQRLARRIFLRLIQFGEGRANTRRQQPLAALRAAGDDAALFNATLQTLVDSRLLTVTSTDNATTTNRRPEATRSARIVVDIAHEALITGWPRLQEWLMERREAEQIRRGLEAKAAEWVRFGRGTGGLLDEVELREVERWLQQADTEDLGYSEDLSRLTQVSRTAIEEANRQREEARQQLLEQAQALAKQNQELQRQLALSESQRLAYIAKTLPDDFRETALLLACEAVLHDHNPQSEQVLRDALDKVNWQVTALRGHRAAVHRALFSPDGRRVVTASADGIARVWSTDGKSLAVLAGHTEALQTAAFSHDGQHIVTASADGTARLWWSDGRPLALLPHSSPPIRVDLSGQYVAVHSASFSPDGQYVVTLSEAGVAKLWNRDGTLLPMPWDATPQLETAQAQIDEYPGQYRERYEHAKMAGHMDGISLAVFTPQGQILTGSSDNTLRLWDCAGCCLGLFSNPEYKDWPLCAAFSSDGQRILTGGTHKSAWLWSMDGQLLAELPGHTDDVISVAFRYDGQQILTLSPHDSARLWTTEGRPLATLSRGTPANRIHSAAFTPDGRILTATADGRAQLWDAEGQLLTTLVGHTSAIRSAEMSPDGTYILTASDDGTARLWDEVGPPLPTLKGHTAAVQSARYWSDAPWILTSSADGTTRLWDTAGKEYASLPGTIDLTAEGVCDAEQRRLILWQPVWVERANAPQRLKLPPISISDDRDTFFFGQDGRTWDEQANPPQRLEVQDQLPAIDKTNDPWYERVIEYQLWDLASVVASRLNPSPLQGSTDLDHQSKRLISQGSAVFSPDGLRILIQQGGGIAIWDAEGRPLTQIESPAKLALFSPDSRMILTGQRNGEVRLWSANGDLLLSVQADEELEALAWSADCQRFVTGADGPRRARLWDHQGNLINIMRCDDKVKRIVYGPSGRRILTISTPVELWDGDGRPLGRIGHSDDTVRDAAFSPDGRVIYSIADTTLRLWDTDGRSIATLRGHNARINSVAFDHDGRRLVTASADGTARLWSTDGHLLAVFVGHNGLVNSAVFSPDERFVLTASEDGTARQYFVDVQHLLLAAAHRVGRELTDSECEQFSISTLLFDAANLR